MQRSFSDAILADAYQRAATACATDTDRLIIYIHEAVARKLSGEGTARERLIVTVKHGFPWAAAGALLGIVGGLLGK